MKKVSIVLLTVLLMFSFSTSLFAEGTKETKATTTADGKTVVKWAAYGYLKEDKATKIKEAFEAKYPQYDVEYVDLGSDQYLVTLDTAIASGESFDMVLAFDSTEYVKRAAEGMFLPIEDYLTEDGFDLEDAFGSGINASYVDGELYGLPYTKGGFYVFYNKDMFDAAGLEYPTDDWTWEDFENTSKALTKDGIYGSNVHFTWGYDIETLPAQEQGWIPFKDADYTQANMEDPRLKSALVMWNRMQNEDKDSISLQTYEAEQISSRMPFAKGQSAMLLSNWWSAQWLIYSKFGSADGDKLLNFDFDVVNIPRPEGDYPDNLNSTDLDWYFAVPNTAENPEGGALLARFMICEMWSKLGTLSSYRHQNLDEFMAKFVTYVADDGTVYTYDYSKDFVEKIMGGWTQPISAYIGFDSQKNPKGMAIVKDIYDQERQLYYYGEQTIDETLANMQSRVQEELDALN